MTRRYPSDKMVTPDRPGPSLVARMAWRLLESVPDPAFAKDREGRYLYVNEATCRILGRSEDELLGRRAEDLFERDDADRLGEADERVLAGETVESRHELESHEGNGSVTYQIIKTPLRDDGGRIQGVAGIARDVSAFETAHQARRELEQKLLQAQKLESLSVMAGGIAHDFNNLLAAILGNAELALQVVRSDSSAHDCLQDIRDASLRAAELSKQMLAFSGRAAMTQRELRLNDELRSLKPLLESSISKKATLAYNLGPELPPLRGDPAQLRQLIVNLVTNASEALPDGQGVIRVKTELAYWDRVQLASTYVDDDLEPGDYVQILVTDDGCGMDEKTRAKLFEPFYSEKFVGRGLGMAAALGIVRGHRGAIEVRSTPNEGTTVTVALPSAAGPDSDTDAAPSGTRRRQRARIRTPVGHSQDAPIVLVVDDEPSVLSLAQRILSQAGYRILTASDGRAGLELLARFGDQVRLVLLDLTMPYLDGNETYRLMREAHPELAVILSSGYNQREVQERFTGTGLAGFIQKPYHPTRLLQTVARILGE
jgi:PAS domain S-box-containing protein